MLLQSDDLSALFEPVTDEDDEVLEHVLDSDDEAYYTPVCKTVVQLTVRILL